jgi:hypothetical protein
MRRDLISRLADAGMTLFWTVLIANELRRGDHHIPGDDYRWVSASASYVLKGDVIERVGALAGRYRPGPSLEHAVRWTPRETDG